MKNTEAEEAVEKSARNSKARMPSMLGAQPDETAKR